MPLQAKNVYHQALPYQPFKHAVIIDLAYTLTASISKEFHCAVLTSTIVQCHRLQRSSIMRHSHSKFKVTEEYDSFHPKIDNLISSALTDLFYATQVTRRSNRLFFSTIGFFLLTSNVKHIQLISCIASPRTVLRRLYLGKCIFNLILLVLVAEIRLWLPFDPLLRYLTVSVLFSTVNGPALCRVHISIHTSSIPDVFLSPW